MNERIREWYEAETGMVCDCVDSRYVNWLERRLAKAVESRSRSTEYEIKKILDELQLKTISMDCFAQEHFKEPIYDGVKHVCSEIRSWIKTKRK